MQVTQAMLRLMDDPDRHYWSARLGLPPEPAAEELAKYDKRGKLEVDEQKKFLAWVEREAYAYVWHRTDKASTANLGVADFVLTIKGGRSVAVEFKVGRRKLTAEQAEWRRRHEGRGGVYMVVAHHQLAIDAVLALEREVVEKP